MPVHHEMGQERTGPCFDLNSFHVMSSSRSFDPSSDSITFLMVDDEGEEDIESLGLRGSLLASTIYEKDNIYPKRTCMEPMESSLSSYVPLLGSVCPIDEDIHVTTL